MNTASLFTGILAVGLALSLIACDGAKTPPPGKTVFYGHCLEVSERLGKRVGGFGEVLEDRRWNTDRVMFVSIFFLDATPARDRHWVKCAYPLDLPEGEHINAEEVEFDGVNLTHADRMLVNSALTGWRNR